MRWLLLLLLALPASADTLGELVSTLRARYPSAQVVSGFNDWRTTSIYRSHAGLHLGYDITLPYGSAVPAAWSGRVVAITPWGSGQYGISVVADSGLEATYGHLSPMVSVGQRIEPGTPVGRTLIDHVDVKMRDGHGAYVDFGAGGALATAPRQVGPSLADERQAEDEAERWEGKVATLEAQPRPVWPLERTAELLADGAISRAEAESVPKAKAVEAKLAEARKKLEAARKRRDRLAAALKVKVKGKAKTPVPAHLQHLVAEGVLTREEAAQAARVPPRLEARRVSPP